MAEWTVTDGMACYDGVAEDIPLVQLGVLDVGMLYFVKFSIANMTMGKLQLQGFEDTNEYTEDGDYELIAIATLTDIRFNPVEYLGDIFDGCITSIEVNQIPFYSIKNSDGDIIFQQIDSSGVTADRNYIQYIIDWTTFEEGCYYIEIVDGTVTYISDLFLVKLTHPCTLLLTWSNNEDGFGFDYSGLAFIQSMRVESKLHKWKHSTVDKEVFRFSNGDEKILYARVYEEETLSIKQISRYMSKAFSLALNHDTFEIEGLTYIWNDDEVIPVHRNTTNAPSIEVILRRKIQNLLNSNCG